MKFIEGVVVNWVRSILSHAARTGEDPSELRSRCYRIEGIDEVHGAPVTRILSARSSDDARRRAEELGMSVTGVEVY